MSIRKPHPITVAHSYGFICGKRIDYKLVKDVERVPVYRIKISFCGEVLERRLSRNITEAARIYGLIVKNSVTPCTLDDVIEDNCPMFFKKIAK